MQVSRGLRRRGRGGACSEGSQAIRLATLAEVTPSTLWLDVPAQLLCHCRLQGTLPGTHRGQDPRSSHAEHPCSTACPGDGIEGAVTSLAADAGPLLLLGRHMGLRNPQAVVWRKDAERAPPPSGVP